MNFLYVKLENTDLNINDFSLDLRKFNDLNKAIVFCNSNDLFQGVYVVKTDNLFMAFKHFAADEDPPIDKLFLKNTLKNTGNYIITKNSSFYSDGDTLILLPGDSLNELYNFNNNNNAESIIIQGKNVYKYPKNSYKPVVHKNNINVLSAIQKDANCIFILYKCETEIDRIKLNWEKAVFQTIIYTSSPVVELKSFVDNGLIKSGKYLVRQIYFIEVESGEFIFQSVFRGSSFLTYINNVAVKKSWVPGGDANYFIFHSYEIKLNKGVHSIMNDFSFDTNNTTYTETNSDGSVERYELDTMQSFKLKGNADFNIINDILYQNNPLMVRSFINSENKYFIDKCTGANYKNISSLDTCQKIFNENYLSEEARLEFKKIFMSEDFSYNANLNIAEDVIKYIYLDNNTCKNNNEKMDYDSIRFVKERIEAYFIKMFYNLEEMIKPINFQHIKFLLPILSKCGDISKTLPIGTEEMIYSNFITECYNENNRFEGTGVCEMVEKVIRDGGNPKYIEEVNSNVNNKDFIFCTKYNINEDKYGFEKDSVRCQKTVLSNSELTNYLMSGKCTNDNNEWKGGERCINKSLNLLNIENQQRKLYYQQILTSKERIDNLVDGKEVETLSQFVNYAANEFLQDKAMYENIDFLISEPMVNICSSPDPNGRYYNLCDGIYSAVKYTQPIGNDQEKSKLLEAKDIINNIEKTKNLNSCLSNPSGNIETNCKFIFNTDNDTNIILYSGEVLKICNENPFSENCIKYYEDISNINKKNKKNDQEAASGFINKPKDSIIFYLILLICIVIAFLAIFPRVYRKYKLQSNNKSLD
jgi:hypothetical protein